MTANFGGGGVPANDQFTIGGKITGFVLQHGEENDWAVGLGLADFSGRPDGTAPGESDPGTPSRIRSAVWLQETARLPLVRGMGCSTVMRGTSIMTTTTPRTINTPPAAVVGEFNANFTDGTAAGGFGANKK